MPRLSNFAREHQCRRWAAYLSLFVGGERNITPTALNTRLSGSQGVSRVSQWLRGKRIAAEATAWDVGRALRLLGASTNELEALWAAGYFPALIRLLQLIAADIKAGGPAIAARLFSVLPAQMVLYETQLVANLESIPTGAQYLWAYRQLHNGGSRYTEVRIYDWKSRQYVSAAARDMSGAAIAIRSNFL
jgi:hypothetical protein